MYASILIVCAFRLSRHVFSLKRKYKLAARLNSASEVRLPDSCPPALPDSSAINPSGGPPANPPLDVRPSGSWQQTFKQQSLDYQLDGGSSFGAIALVSLFIPHDFQVRKISSDIHIPVCCAYDYTYPCISMCMYIRLTFDCVVNV